MPGVFSQVDCCYCLLFSTFSFRFGHLLALADYYPGPMPRLAQSLFSAQTIILAAVLC